jgi:hypothetical protein
MTTAKTTVKAARSLITIPRIIDEERELIILTYIGGKKVSRSLFK